MSSHPSIEEKGEDVFITIKAHPSSSKRHIILTDFEISIYVNEPPDKGKANKAIVKLLSKKLSIPSSTISIIKGIKSQTKVILLRNLKEHSVIEKLR